MNREEFEAKIHELWTKSRVPLTEKNLAYFAGVEEDTLIAWLDELLDTGFLDLLINDSPLLQYRVPGLKRSTKGPATCQAHEKKRKLIEIAKARILAKRAGKVRPTKQISNKKNQPPKKEQATSKTNSLDLDVEIGLKAQSSLSKIPKDKDDDGSDNSSVIEAVGKVALKAGGKALIAIDKPLSMLDKPRGKGEKSLALSGGLSLLGPLGWLYAGSFREAIPATAAAVAAYYVVPSFLMAPFLLVGMALSGAVGLTYAWQYNRKKGRTPLFLPQSSKKKAKKLPE